MKKISLIGTGNVGATAAQRIAELELTQSQKEAFARSAQTVRKMIGKLDL